MKVSVVRSYFPNIRCPYSASIALVALPGDLDGDGFLRDDEVSKEVLFLNFRRIADCPLTLETNIDSESAENTNTRISMLVEGIRGRFPEWKKNKEETKKRKQDWEVQEEYELSAEIGQ